MHHIDGQHFGVVPYYRSGLDCLSQPFRHQALGEFALRVLVAEHGPLMACVQSALDSLQFHLTESCCRFLGGEAPVQPQSGAHFHRAAPALLVQQHDKVHGMHQVRALTQQLFPLPQ